MSLVIIFQRRCFRDVHCLDGRLLFPRRGMMLTGIEKRPLSTGLTGKATHVMLASWIPRRSFLCRLPECRSCSHASIMLESPCLRVADKVYYSCPTDLIEPAVLLVVTASWVLPRLSFIRFCRFKSPYLCLDSSGSVDSSS